VHERGESPRVIADAVGARPYPSAMLSSRAIVVDLDELLISFTAATVSRGLAYVKQRRVRDATWSDDGLALTGRCSGSGDNAYRVAARFELHGAGVRLARTECSCPVSVYCKHAVALLIAAASSESRPRDPDRWRTVFSKVLDETAPPGDDHGSPIGVQFSIAAPMPHRPGTAIVMRLVTIGKCGTWVRSGLNWQRVIYHADAGEFDRRQYAALRRLATEVQLRLDFVSDDASGATLDEVDGLKITCGDDRDTGVHRAVEQRPEGLWHGVVRLGRFDPLPGRTTLDLVVRGEVVHIPAERVAEFSLDVLPRLIDSAPVEIAEGLFAPPSISDPIPVLTITLGEDGARASWSTRYRVNGQQHDFDPETRPSRTSYRDVDAEETAWAAVDSALQAVASSSRAWKQQALQHVRQRMRSNAYVGAFEELLAIDDAPDAAAAAAVASTATLRAGVDLTLAEAAVLCGEVLPQLDRRDSFTVELDQGVSDFRAAQNAPVLEFGSGDGEPVRNDWFDLSITVDIDGYQVPMSAVITQLTSGATHMLLPNGVYFPLATPELLRLRELIEEARALGEIEGDKVNAGSYNATLWDELLSLGVVDEQVASWRESIARMAAARPPVPVDVPEGLDATLRDYQRDGLNWLSFLWDNGLGGVLADDMGLGKTLQTLALIARAAEQGSKRFLVVAPTSVVTNWVAECDKFTPGLTAVAITSTEARSGTPLSERVAAADIVVTSYALLRIDFEAYAGIDWAGVILDEAQFVKNHASKTHQCVRRLEARFKLAITGTPMENNLMELWSLLSITAPGLFPSPTVFANYFRRPIESGGNSERLPVLRRRIRPVMLRRTKSEVATELPPKHEQVLTLDLSAKHRKIYDIRMARERQKVLGLLGDWEKNRFQVFRSLTLLRQLSLHPGLVDEANLDVGAAKIEFLVEQLPVLVAQGHSALVFSQFTGFLDILRAHLDAIGVSYSYLDGSASSRQRDTAIRSFKAGANQVFLISLKAGGFGLNLTEADYCFVCDPWWNPAAEAQAIDRTHRIGQTRPVTVYRLVSQGTIEEKVVALQNRKRELFSAVLDEGEVFGSAITASDVRELFG
jgi:superfamily II DNA or RNA helicase